MEKNNERTIYYIYDQFKSFDLDLSLPHKKVYLYIITPEKREDLEFEDTVKFFIIDKEENRAIYKNINDEVKTINCIDIKEENDIYKEFLNCFENDNKNLFLENFRRKIFERSEYLVKEKNNSKYEKIDCLQLWDYFWSNFVVNNI